MKDFANKLPVSYWRIYLDVPLPANRIWMSWSSGNFWSFTHCWFQCESYSRELNPSVSRQIFLRWSSALNVIITSDELILMWSLLLILYTSLPAIVLDRGVLYHSFGRAFLHKNVTYGWSCILRFYQYTDLHPRESLSMYTRELSTWYPNSFSSWY